MSKVVVKGKANKHLQKCVLSTWEWWHCTSFSIMVPKDS